MSETKKPGKHKGWYHKDGKKVSTKQKHSETYSNETYKYIKEGNHLQDAQGRARVGAGKGDANRTSRQGSFRENYDEIDWSKK
jgi:hypothetical protein